MPICIQRHKGHRTVSSVTTPADVRPTARELANTQPQPATEKDEVREQTVIELG